MSARPVEADVADVPEAVEREARCALLEEHGGDGDAAVVRAADARLGGHGGGRGGWS